MTRLQPLLLPWAVLAVAAIPGAAAAQNPGPDLIPEDGLVGVTINHLRPFGAKLAKLSKELNLPVGPIDGLLASVQLDKGVDLKGSLAVVVPNLEKMGIKFNDPPTPRDTEALLKNLVLVLPVGDAEEIATNFGLKKGALKPGTVTTGKHAYLTALGQGADTKLLLTDRFLYVGHADAALQAVREAKPLPGSLTADQARTLRDADVVVHVGPLGLGDNVRASFLSKLEKDLFLGDPDDDVVKQLSAAAKEVRGVSLAVKVEDGLTLDFMASFTRTDGAAAKFLTVLRGGPGTSDLNGLPAANPLAAYAAKGDGTRNAHQARALLKLLLKNAFGLDVALQGEDRAKLLAAFDVLYKHLRGSRAAAYAVDAGRTATVGRVSAVVILDLDDAAEHLSGWTTFIDVANRTSLKVNGGDATKAPKFTFTPAAEKLDGVPVDVLAMDNPALAPSDRDRNVKARGPDWNKIKMVTVGKQIVALFGSSDMELLRTAIKTVREGGKGLAGYPAMAAHLATLPAERKIELHGSGGAAAAFGLDVPAKGPTGSWISLALVVEPDRLHVRWRLPLVELKALRN